ncbi:hypothetical protein [Actinacidiphila yeochonensis]|uniref:hypothetical protein n=1 Tax=Actinacidiphila yeochonensis TaxID=89050 RepID=UPI00055F129B|nr:hypothetical protein [Actinacidiphila yeochonensis]
MLSVRLLRGARAVTLARWALVVLTSCGTGLLLLGALGWALSHPSGGTPHLLVRLAWCAVPVVATAQFAAAVGRAQPAGWPRSGLAAAGLGRGGLALIAAATAILVCAVGSGLALLVFMLLRGALGGEPYRGVGPGVLAAGQSLPPAGVVTLLAVVPLAAGAACSTRLRLGRRGADEEVRRAPAGLPWGVALVAVGLAVESGARHGHGMPLPSGLGRIAPAAAAGWVLVTVGLVLVGPGLLDGCGRLLAGFRPGVVRLLSGRALQGEARRLGPVVGMLSATAAAAVSAYGLRQDAKHPLGPVTAFGAVLVMVCVLGTAASAAAESRAARRPAVEALRGQAAPAATLRAMAAVRVAALVAAFLLPALVVASLSNTA